MEQPGSHFSYRVPVIHREDYTVTVQMLNLNDQMLPFIHCDISKWNKGVLKSLKEDWKTYRTLVNSKFLALNELDDEKHRKFLSSFEFTFLAPLTCDDGVERNLYISN